MPTLRQAAKDDIMLIHELALQAFPATYRDLLSQEQMDFMMDWMYSPANLEKQMEEGHVYFIAKGERYWLDDSDEAILKQTNREFEQPTPLEQLFLCHFHPAENEEEGDWMTPMEILSFLQTKTKDRLSINKVALFGRALHKLGISSRRKTRGTEYHVVKKE